MPVRKVRNFLATAEEFVEDLILILLSIFVIILAVSALLTLATQAPDLTEREQTIAGISQLGFLAKAEYFATLILPWVLMIIGLLLARELWLIRRSLQGIHFENIMKRIKPKKNKRKR